MIKKNRNFLDKKYNIITIFGIIGIVIFVIAVIIGVIFLISSNKSNNEEDSYLDNISNDLNNLSEDINNEIISEQIIVIDENIVSSPKVYSASEIYQIVKDSMFFVETVCDLEITYPSFKITYKADDNDELQIDVTKSEEIIKIDDFSDIFQFTGSGFLLNNKMYTNYHVIDCEPESVETLLKDEYYSLVEYHLSGYLDKTYLEEIDFDFENKITEIYDHFYKSRKYDFYYDKIVIEDLLVANISEYLSETIGVKELGKEVYAYHESDQFTNSINLEYYKSGISFPGRDYAILNLDYNVPNLIFNEDYKVTIGEEIYVIGFPSIEIDSPLDIDDYDTWEVKKEPPIITKGIISSLKQSNNGVKYYVLDAAAYYGSSGGPVINKNGEVIGILTAGVDNFNFMLPLFEIDD
jgi:S1-C subfamily serine protease